MLVAVTLGLLVLGSVVVLHYEALHLVGVTLPRIKMGHRPRMLIVLAATIVAHLLEIGIFGVVYYALEHWFGLGTLEGQTTKDFSDYLYFSATSYTTLGYGDVHPIGPLRIIAGIEALLGLVMITWSASYTYLTVREYW